MKNTKLIILIIILLLLVSGSTFAYFAVSANNGLITGDAADIELTLTVTKVLPSNDNVDDILITSFEEMPDNLNDSCVYGNSGFATCQLYRVNLANASGKVNTNVTGSLSFDNENVSNLSWLFLGNSYSSSTNYTSTMLGDTFNTASSTFTSFVDGYLLMSGSNVNFYILVWVNETEDVQNDEGSYSGTVRFEDSNGNGATATFNS